ncbi:hypothetical protein [Streptomyces cyaneofuscatus]|uniref:hypothetical protein n=1 Tax=Streptomyces cyaneofuscatus TaxID=66883 RepID=UPI0036D919A2
MQRGDRPAFGPGGPAEAPSDGADRFAEESTIRTVVDRNRRLCALQELRNLVSDGALDMDLLLDKRNYRGGSTQET